MTVTTTTIKTIAQGNGVTTSFAFSFVGVSADVISVIYTDATGVDTTLLTSQYDLALNAALPGAIWGIGGTVEYPLVGTPIATGTTLTIIRELPLEQDVSLQNQASYGQLSEQTEQALDLLAMQVQQLSELLGRAISVPVSDVDPPDALPPAAQRANQALVFDGDGQPTAGELPASGVISSAMAPVVSAGSLAAGRAAFGLGDAALEGIGAGLQDDGSGNLRVNWAISEVATNQAIGAASHLVQYLGTGPINFTFVRANTLWNGFSLFITAVSAAITCLIDANDAFKGQDSGVAFVILPGESVLISTNAAASGTWLVRRMPQIEAQFQCALSKSGSTLRIDRVDGSNLFINGRNEVIPAAGVAYAPAATGSTLYYVYAFMSAGVMTLEVSTTVPTISTIYGHLIKTGDATRTFMGLARTDGSGNWTDSATQRFTRSWFNDHGLQLTNAFTANRTTTSTSYAEISTEIRIEFVTFANEIVLFGFNGQAGGSGLGVTPFLSIGIDGATAEDTFGMMETVTGSGAGSGLGGTLYKALALGYHYATLVGKVGSGTGTYVGSGTAGTRTTLRGYLRR